MKDHFGRNINYLRLSITDRCNLRCKYCMPNGIECVEHKDILSFEEIRQIAVCGARLGITKIRLTGGEPLARKGCPELIRMLKEIPGIEKVLGTPVEFNAKGITWNRRFNMYLDKMKSGNVLDVTEVIHILQTQENEKKLSTGERRLLGNARQILVSEMMLVCDESQKDAEKWLDKFFE